MMFQNVPDTNRQYVSKNNSSLDQTRPSAVALMDLPYTILGLQHIQTPHLQVENAAKLPCSSFVILTGLVLGPHKSSRILPAEHSITLHSGRKK